MSFDGMKSKTTSLFRDREERVFITLMMCKGFTRSGGACWEAPVSLYSNLETV